MDLSSLTPEGISPLVAAIVIVASFFTAAMTASFGIGGGLALLAVMSALFPPAAVVPVHGVAQLGSNLSRFGLQRRDVVFPIMLWFGLGGAVGAFAGARLYVELPEELLRAAVGFFILFTVWGPRPRAFAPGRVAFFATGAAGSFLTMFFGATGPIAATMLSTTKLNRMQIVATHAGCMVVQHALKTLAFGVVGFAFGKWALLILAVVVAGFLGTWLGTRLLKDMPEARFKQGFKAMLTLIALYLLGAAAYAALRTR